MAGCFMEGKGISKQEMKTLPCSSHLAIPVNVDIIRNPSLTWQDTGLGVGSARVGV